MDRFGPTGKVSKKRFHLLRWSSFPGRTGLNFGSMDRAPAIRVQISVGPKQQFLGWLLKALFFTLFCKPHVLSKLTEILISER